MPDSAAPHHAADIQAKDVDALTEGEATMELERLAQAMGEAERLYFREDAPTLSDAEYDALKRRNLAIESRFPDLLRPDSPSRRVGSAPSEQFAPVEHGVPMLSLDNGSCASTPTTPSPSPPSRRSTASPPVCATKTAN
jgi:hypothetical protein